MAVREEHGIDAGDAGIEHLLAQVGRCVDEHGGARLLDQDRDAPPAVLRVLGIAIAPIAADARHTPRRSAAEHRHPHQDASGGFALVKSVKKFAVVASASASGEMPLSSATSAAVWVMKAGALVSTSKRSSGKSRTIPRNSCAVLKVTMPESEIQKPSFRACSASMRPVLKQWMTPACGR